MNNTIHASKITSLTVGVPVFTDAGRHLGIIDVLIDDRLRTKWERLLCEMSEAELLEYQHELRVKLGYEEWCEPLDWLQ